MTGIHEQKRAIRKQAAAARNRAHAAATDAGPALLDHFPDIPAGAIVSGYAAIRSEVDAIPLMRVLHDRGHRLCLPVIEAAGRPLSFRAWSPGARMVAGPFGAQVPEDGDRLEPGVLLVPLLAFDRLGFRLGYGGGFYDRTLERLRALGPILAIGLAYAAQEVARVPIDATDQRLDAILTETGLILPEPVEVP